MVSDPWSFRGRLEFYRTSPERVESDRSSFYKPECSDLIAETLKAVVNAEGPIVADLAARRVGEHWGYSHLKGRGVEHVMGLVGKANVHMTTDRGERVLWAHSQDPRVRPAARIPSDERSTRTLDQVPLIELAALLTFWIEEAGPMPERELLDHALQSIGLQKLGKLIRVRLERALETGVSLDWIEIRGGVVRTGAAL